MLVLALALSGCGGSASVGAKDAGANTDSGSTGDAAGSFVHVACGATTACALRTDGEIACWGTSIGAEPAGPFTELAAANAYVCGLHEDGTVDCAGKFAPTLPVEHAVAISAGSALCSLASDGTVTCSDSVDLPGIFSSVAAGEGDGFACGVRKDTSTVDCSSVGYPGWDNPSGDAFSEIACGELACCGINSAGSLECWGRPETTGERTPPSGSFAHLRNSSVYPCAQRADGTLACWGGWLAAFPADTVPTDAFSDYCVGDGFGCGVLSDGSLKCWGTASNGQTAPPSN